MKLWKPLSRRFKKKKERNKGMVNIKKMKRSR